MDASDFILVCGVLTVIVGVFAVCTGDVYYNSYGKEGCIVVPGAKPAKQLSKSEPAATKSSGRR